jgi:hypothetical protein
MKLIIAGSRHLDLDSEGVQVFVDHLGIKNITEIVAGGARGIDTAGENYARDNHIPYKIFPAEWGLHGKAAGFIRNKQMADYADELLIIWDQKSAGSAHMKETMEKMGKPVHEGTF